MLYDEFLWYSLYETKLSSQQLLTRIPAVGCVYLKCANPFCGNDCMKFLFPSYVNTTVELETHVRGA